MSTTEEQQRAADELDKIRDLATEASGDLLEDIVRLERMAEVRRPDKALEERYERLRAYVTDQLVRSGPRYYLDDNGVKRYAYAVTPETVIADVDAIVALHEEGKLPHLEIDKVFPRGQNNEELRRALSRKVKVAGQTEKVRVIPAEVVSKHIKIVPKGKGYTRFADPVDDQ